MPRALRFASGNWMYHVLNRANGNGRLFESSACYRDFQHILAETADELAMRILAHCLMPNHWHLLLWPREDGDLSRFAHRLTSRHTQRWHLRNGTLGRGHLYQSRFKSFAVQNDFHLVTVCRYIEQNPLRAGLVDDMYAWPWSSAASRWTAGRQAGEGAATGAGAGAATPTPVAIEPLPFSLPPEMRRWWSEVSPEDELAKLRMHVARNKPFGGASWAREAKRRRSRAACAAEPVAPEQPATEQPAREQPATEQPATEHPGERRELERHPGQMREIQPRPGKGRGGERREGERCQAPFEAKGA